MWIKERHYRGLERNLYNITLKTHNFWHMAEQAFWSNPRGGWRYADERFIGLVARAAAATACGGLGGLGKSFPKRWACHSSNHACTRIEARVGLMAMHTTGRCQITRHPMLAAHAKPACTRPRLVPTCDIARTSAEVAPATAAPNETSAAWDI